MQSYFDEHPTERFLFRLNDQKLNSIVNAAHPELQSLAISSPMPGEFQVATTFREPLLSWKSGDAQLYIDKEGYAFRQNYFTEPK